MRPGNPLESVRLDLWNHTGKLIPVFLVEKLAFASPTTLFICRLFCSHHFSVGFVSLYLFYIFLFLLRLLYQQRSVLSVPLSSLSLSFCLVRSRTSSFTPGDRSPDAPVENTPVPLVHAFADNQNKSPGSISLPQHPRLKQQRAQLEYSPKQIKKMLDTRAHSRHNIRCSERKKDHVEANPDIAVTTWHDSLHPTHWISEGIASWAVALTE